MNKEIILSEPFKSFKVKEPLEVSLCGCTPVVSLKENFTTSGTSNNEIEDLKNRVNLLERREDSDTIFDPSNILSRLELLENKPDNDTIFNPEAILNRLNALESKEDNDTIYDDSELRRDIQDLKNRPSSAPYDDSAITRRVSQLENNPATVTSSSLEVEHNGSNYNVELPDLFKRITPAMIAYLEKASRDIGTWDQPRPILPVAPITIY